MTLHIEALLFVIEPRHVAAGYLSKGRWYAVRKDGADPEPMHADTIARLQGTYGITWSEHAKGSVPLCEPAVA